MSITFYADGATIDYEVEVDPFLNLANTNAVMVLERLGLDYEAYSCEATDFLGRCMTANVGRDDEGIEDRRDGNIVWCGVPAGYFEEKMKKLEDVAHDAIKKGVRVCWD